MSNGLFLGVEQSATGRAWRDRLDERGSARALAIAQRHDLPELLARIIAGRNVEVDGSKPSSIRPSSVRCPTRMCLPRCRKRPRALPTRSRAAKQSPSSATTMSMARPRPRCWPASCAGRDRAAHSHPGPPVRRLRPECRGDPVARRARRDAPCHRRLRHHQHRAASRGAQRSASMSRHRPSPGRRDAAAGLAIVNPNRRDDLSGLGYLAAVGLVFLRWSRSIASCAARGFWTARAARAGFARLSRRRRARHRRRRGAADRAQPRFCCQGFDRDAPAPARRPTA